MAISRAALRVGGLEIVADAYESTTTVQLAMMAYYTDSIVKWDSHKRTITGNPRASNLLKREYRKGWHHPG